MTIIGDVGESVTITHVTRAIDEYGDATETTSTSSVNAIIEILEADEELLKSGILNIGDAIGYFKPTDSASIKEGNRVAHNSIDYVITAVEMYGIGGTNLHMQARLKKVVT